jgi:hypothetical protein
MCFDKTVASHATTQTEREANAFAVELLMPVERWKRAADTAVPTMDLIRELAAEHQVSLQTATIRFVELSSAPCAAAYCEGRAAVWTAHSPRASFRIDRGTQPKAPSLAAGFLQGLQMPETPTPVPAISWLPNLPKSMHDAEVIEHCVPMPGMHAALSLIRPAPKV